MNRRHLVLTTIAAALTTQVSSAQTPVATPLEDGVNPTARILTHEMQALSPVTLLETLETTPMNDRGLLAAASNRELIVKPWADYGDTDLYHSLGGVAISRDNLSLSDPESEMVAGYIVYESAEIAYHEFARKLGDLNENPSATMSTSGVNVWIVESDDIQIGVCRIGYVIILTMMTDTSDGTVTGAIEHLAEVAQLAGA